MKKTAESHYHVEGSVAIVEMEGNIYSKQNDNDFVVDGNGTIFTYTGSDISVVIPARIGDVLVSAKEYPIHPLCRLLMDYYLRMRVLHKELDNLPMYLELKNFLN